MELKEQVEEKVTLKVPDPGDAVISPASNEANPAAPTIEERPAPTIPDTPVEASVAPTPSLLKEQRAAIWKKTKSDSIAYLKLELRAHMVPLCVLGMLLLCPRLLILWLPLALIWSGIEALHPRLPLALRLRANRIIPERIRASNIFQEFRDGIAQVRPFILISLYLFVIPFSLIWMSAHWLRSLFGFDKQEPKRSNASIQDGALEPSQQTEVISFLQDKRKHDEESESNFFHSPAFAITCVALFGCGLPATITYLMYQKLGIDAMLGFPSQDPNFHRVFVTIGLYIYSLAWCLSVLFIRSWFTFPLNFLGEEARIEIDAQRIRRRLNSWMSQVMTMNMPWAGRESMKWDEVHYIGYRAPHGIRLYPLPTTIFSADTLFYKILNKGAQFIDGVSDRMPSNEVVYFSSADQHNGSRININLSDLDGDERARLFYAVRKWAPHVVIDQRVQDQMLGSSVMQAPRYTQMWFELLTNKMPRKRLGSLAPGEKLRNGEITIIQRLSSGGQANVYVAEKSDGTEVIMKEFILSSADAIGALVESAGEFETESTLLSELEHPRIVRMLDFFAEDRRLYIVLERVPGTSLREYVKANGPLSEADTIKLGLQIAEVLGYLHEQSPPVVHRDIAPDNVVFDGRGEIKVIDFSLAAGKKSRKTTSTMGKHSYAPPEQLRELPCTQSDIYALGATLSFLLTGVDPKPITTADVQAKRPEVSNHLARILKHATELDVENRYSDIKWLKLDLEGLARAGCSRASEPDAQDACSAEPTETTAGNVGSRSEE